jgi:glycosyltransferase involved in cell wall biosynthesis
VSATGPRRRDVAVVGRVVAWKAVPLAVRTMAHVPDAVLRVYGYATDTESARVLHAARRYGVADRVEMLGAMPREQLLERVATSGVVLHPSLHDEASFTVAEARALGTPIVALRHGGPPHVAAAWAPAGAQFVRPSTPGRTAHALGRAVRAALDEPPPVLTRGVPPRIDFAQHVLAAYERAARSTAS